VSLPEPYYSEDGITIYCGDCRDVLPGLVAVDLVLTDPPYGLGDKWQGGKRQWPLQYEGGDSLTGVAWDSVRIEGLYELIGTGPACVWGGHLYPLPVSRGWLIWDKKQNDRFSSGQAEPAWTTLDQPIRTFRMSRVEAYCNPRDPKLHPTQKPLDLIKWCLGYFTEAQLIVDPFMGSGTTLVAAKELGRHAIGIEVEEKYCAMAVKRLAQGVLPI
jgi:DNA modification methylase